jgi:hypothetical protein
MTRLLAAAGGLRLASLLLAPWAALFGCEGPLPAENPKTQPDQRAEFMPILGGDPASNAKAAKVVSRPRVVFENVGLETPESVLYDADRDLYIVSNIKGKPDAVDGDGFLSTLSPDGTVLDLGWIRGGQQGVTLNAPKGSGLFGGKLWVTDIDHVRRFDVKTGKMDKAIAVPGATFLNDLAIAKDGTVYFTDSGWKVGKEGMDATNSDAIYKLVGDKPTALAKSPDLGQPNGIFVDGERVFFAASKSKALVELDASGKEQRRVDLPGGDPDGLVQLGSDDFLVSSWAERAVYRGGFATTLTPLLEDEPAPADIGFDTKRRRVLIPLFLSSAVHAVDLDPPAAPATAPVSTPSAAQSGATPSAQPSSASTH